MPTHIFSMVAVLAVLLLSCKKEKDEDHTLPTGGGVTAPPLLTIVECEGQTVPQLVLKFRFDSTQVRLNAFGQPVDVLPGHAAQHPRFNSMSAHYVEFTPNVNTPLGSGDVVYHAPETAAGGGNAIDFAQGVRVGDGGTFLCLPLSALSPGSYEWLRVSLAYQNYTIRFRALNLALTGTVASFIGYNTYLGTYQVADSMVAVNANKLQGYWAFEVNNPPIPTPVTQGEAPPGATTVPNPLFLSSPIPAGSCVVTAAFPTALTITGNETEDVVITVSLSTNKSFEWIETDGDNIFEPIDGETVVDMGIRGMIPTVQ